MNLRPLVRGAKWVTALLMLVVPAMVQAQQTGVAAPPPQSGSVSGTIVDNDGALIANVRVICTQGVAIREAISDLDGYFLVANVAPGPFQLTFAAAGFAPQQKSGILRAGENYLIPQITMAVAPTTTDVEVRLAPVEVAEEQIRVEEKQRILGVFPNFYVSYDHHALPLTKKQKFELAWKTTIDPVSFLITGAIAGFQQANDTYGGYGPGTPGYARRFGADYGDLVSGTFIGGAILPSLLKQDPRYFWKGTGTRRSRLLYALANAVICKGDNGHWQPGYSGILGSLAASGISNLYYPAADRNGARLTFENTLIGIGGGAATNILQEFFLRRFTPHVPNEGPAKN
jgi:carboxypeptidase family protein